MTDPNEKDSTETKTKTTTDKSQLKEGKYLWIQTLSPMQIRTVFSPGKKHRNSNQVNRKRRRTEKHPIKLQGKRTKAKKTRKCPKRNTGFKRAFNRF